MLTDGSCWSRVKSKKAMSTILLKNIYKEGELDKDSTCKEYLQVAHEGSNALKFAAMRAKGVQAVVYSAYITPGWAKRKSRPRSRPQERSGRHLPLRMTMQSSLSKSATKPTSSRKGNWSQIAIGSKRTSFWQNMLKNTCIFDKKLYIFIVFLTKW